MPKRLNTLKRKKRQTTHTPHPHNKKAPRSFHEYTPKFRKNHDCTLQVSHVHRCQVSAPPPICTPKFRNALKSEVSDYLKRPSKFPPIQQSTPKFHNALKSKVSDYLKRPSKFRDVYPSPQTDTLQFLNLKNHLSRSQKVTKRHPEFLYTHEVREFLTIPHP